MRNFTSPRFQREAIVRMPAGDLGDDDSLRASLDGMHADVEKAARANLDAAEVVAESLPHRRRYLLLIHRYGRALLDMHERWLDEAERELRHDRRRRRGPPKRPPERAEL